MARAGSEFERTIFEFYRSLDKNAEVRFDHHVPDHDTKRMRQVDVWVTYRIGDHIPVTTLISCKDHARPLDVGEVETLSAEVRSMRANCGVLYSRKGFTQGAVEKGRALGIFCCRYYDNAPPDCPTELLLDAYVAVPVHQLITLSGPAAPPTNLLWAQILREHVGSPPSALAELISALCRTALERCQPGPEAPQAPGPGDLVLRCALPGVAACPPFELHVALTWQWYHGRLNAHRLTGSKNLNDSTFAGKASVGPIPMHTAPGLAEWEPCNRPPPPDHRIRVTVSAIAGPTADMVRRTMGPTAVFGGGPWTFGPPPSVDLDAALINGLLGRRVGQTLSISTEFRS